MKTLPLTLILLSLFAFSCGDNDTNEPDGHADHNAQKDTTKLDVSSLMLVMHRMDAEMQNAEITGKPDMDFALLMKIHHQSAVEMVDIETAQGSDQEVKALAAKMKTDQLKEIAFFDSLGQQPSNEPANEKFAEAFRSSIKGMDHSSYTAATSIDKEFLQMMIPQHQGAIDMAKAYLPYAKNAALKKTAEQIIASQQKQIDTMRTMQSRIK